MSIIVKQPYTLRHQLPLEPDQVPATPTHVPPSSVLLGMVQSFVVTVIQLVNTIARTVKLTWIGLRTLALTPERR